MKTSRSKKKKKISGPRRIETLENLIPGMPKEKKKQKFSSIVLPELTPSRKKFIQYYLMHKNAVKAYMQAYPNASRATALAAAHRLRANPIISKIIDSALAEEYQAIGLSREALLKRMKEFAFAGPRDKIAIMTLDMLNKHFDVYQGGGERGNTIPEEEMSAYEFIRPKKRTNVDKN